MNAPTTITVLLDGAPYALPAGTTLAALVAGLGHAPGAVGTAVDGRFVARERREAHVLHGGETVLLFQAIVGG